MTWEPARRPLKKADMRIEWASAGICRINVEGQHIEYDALSAEHFEALLPYLSKDMANLREFLMEGDDWTGAHGETPCYRIGWPGGPRVRVVGAKAAVATLRRLYPLKDYQGEGQEECREEASARTPAPPTQSEKIVALRRASPDWTPGWIG